MKSLSVRVLAIAVLAGPFFNPSGAVARTVPYLAPIDTQQMPVYQQEPDYPLDRQQYRVPFQQVPGIPMGSTCVAGELSADLGWPHLVGTFCTIKDQLGKVYVGYVTSRKRMGTICFAGSMWGSMAQAYEVGTPCALADNSGKLYLGWVFDESALKIAVAGGLQ